MRNIFLLVIMTALLVLQGCASDLSGSDYTANQVRQLQTVREGTVTTVQYVKIDGDSSVVGSLGGAALGGVAGSAMGAGKGSDLMAIAGAIAGGVAGNSVEKGVSKSQGVRLTIKLNSGETVSLVQQTQQGVAFAKGDKVQILTSNGVSRAVPAQ